MTVRRNAPLNERVHLARPAGDPVDEIAHREHLRNAPPVGLESLSQRVQLAVDAHPLDSQVGVRAYLSVANPVIHHRSIAQIGHHPAEHPDGLIQNQPLSPAVHDQGQQDEQASHNQYGGEHRADEHAQKPCQRCGEEHRPDTRQNNQNENAEQRADESRKIVDQAQPEAVQRPHRVILRIQGSALDPSGSVVVFHTLRELIPASSAASNDSPPREYPSLSDRLA